MKTIHYLKAAMAIVSAIVLSTGFAACSSDDDDDKQQNVAESEQVTTFDDLAYFQSAFVETDSLGNFISHSVGEPIYDNDPTHLYIGVENIQEALEFWEACLAPDINRTTSADNKYSYTLTDREGKSQGTVSFAPGTENGHVAEITTNATDLKHFKAVTFLLNSAWPFNSSSGTYYLGDVRKVKLDMETDGWLGYKSREVGFVCVREKSNGVKPLYVAITNKTYEPGKISKLLGSKWVPGESKAKNIYKLLHNDWELFVAAFEDAGEGALDKDQDCWIDKDKWYWLGGSYQYAINLISGSVNSHEYLYHNPNRRVLLKIDWEDD